MDLTGANFDNSILTCANISGTGSAKAASFTNVFAAGADFTGMNLRGATFRHAILYGADFTLAAVDMNTKFDGAKVSGADFRGLEFPEGIKKPAIQTFLLNLRTQGAATDPHDDPAVMSQLAGAEEKFAFNIRDIKTQKRNMDFDGYGIQTHDCKNRLQQQGVQLYPASL